MCAVAQNVMDMMDKTVRQFLNEGRMFTAYDVTIETRNREKIHLKHNDTKGAVHEIETLVDAIDYGFDQDNGQTIKYAKTQIQLNANTWSFVFHPVSSDPNKYTVNPMKASTGMLPAAPANFITVNDGSTTDSGGQQSDGTFAVDLRNRLLVPTRFLKDAGFTPKDSVFVFPSPSANSVILAKDNRAIPQGSTSTTQIVESNGDIRLSARTLKMADLNDTSFKIEVKEVDAGTDKCKVVEITA